MHPARIVETRPDHPAIIMATTGKTITYAQMDSRANQTAHFFKSQGLNEGDVIAVCMDNKSARFFDIVWGAQRAGLYFTCISTKLKPEEIQYILEDSDAKLLFGSAGLAAGLEVLPALHSTSKYFSVGGPISGFASYEDAISDLPTSVIGGANAGSDMLYSSGTTGRPKGIKPPLSGDPFDAPSPSAQQLRGLFGMDEHSIYLSPAPLYHAAPLKWCMGVHRLGGTAVIMDRWDEEACLQLIEDYQITCGQFVPTHFVRLLKLSEDIRNSYDVSSLQTVVHAAAPCPRDVKEKMFEWLGPKIHEYYSGTEGVGMCYITPQEWLSHKGSVGRAVVGTIHICDEDGNPVANGERGGVFFEGGPKPSYHNAPEKNDEATNQHGWATMGDIGWLDDEGFLYLTDRKSFTIISGGVNVYPQEIENTLITHPAVMDVAVIGAPDPDLGERVTAVVQLVDASNADDELAAELIAFTAKRLSKIKTPKQLDFRDELPRHPNGKLYKRLLRDEYWNKEGTGIVS